MITFEYGEVVEIMAIVAYRKDHFRGKFSLCSDEAVAFLAFAEGRRGSNFPFGGKQEAAGHLGR